MNFYKPLSLFILFLLLNCSSFSQSTTDSNVPFNNAFLGWNDSGNTDLDFLQNNTNRIRMTSTTWGGYGGAPLLPNASRMYFGVNGNTFETTTLPVVEQVPFSIIQMGYDITPGLRRDWMNVGTTYGAGQDIFYTGILQSPGTANNSDITDAVIAWGCNIPGSTVGPDNIRFLFISPTTDLIQTESSTEEGRETMRITPYGNVGLGNFSTMTGGIGLTYGQPQARLDVQLRGTLSENSENVAAIFLNDCEEIVPSGTSINIKRGIVSTIENSQGPFLELGVAGDFYTNRVRVAVGVRGNAIAFDDGRAYGVRGFSNTTDGAIVHYGVTGLAREGFNNIGVEGLAYVNEDLGGGNFNAGVLGRITPSTADPANNDWAGYFSGLVFASQGYQQSDENLKMNIEPIANATEILSQLQPKVYEYANVDGIYLPSGVEYGILAQELEEVLPELVKDVTTPPAFDAESNTDSEVVEFKAVRYNDLISILIAGFQEQNAVMAAQVQENEALEAQVAELSEQLAAQATQIEEMQTQMTAVMSSFQSTQSKMNNCCGTTPTEKGSTETGGIELEQNFPNPFDEVTTINFTINEPAQIRLEISDSQGRVLEVLVNQTLTEGRYTERWDASAFAPGTYYYSLYANTELLTKKMIKR
ncbi:tail fiber domain-containing protein [Cryomorphaceae bacterium 1068]|nr:tail fiber domain-containing protein [Cryomorphaceae bacterium 1068]